MRFDDDYLPAPAPARPNATNARGRGGMLKPPNWRFRDDIAQTILAALAAGATVGVACQLAGIRNLTFWKWVHQGAKVLNAAVGRYQAAGSPEGDWTDYVEPPDMLGMALFAEKVRRAHAQAQVLYLSYIQRAAANKQWQAAAWLLERRWPEIYGKQPVPTEGAGTGGTTVSVYLPANNRETPETVTGVVIRQRQRPALTSEETPGPVLDVGEGQGDESADGDQ